MLNQRRATTRVAHLMIKYQSLGLSGAGYRHRFINQQVSLPTVPTEHMDGMWCAPHVPSAATIVKLDQHM
jgi:hypothetical protein